MRERRRYHASRHRCRRPSRHLRRASLRTAQRLARRSRRDAPAARVRNRCPARRRSWPRCARAARAVCPVAGRTARRPHGFVTKCLPPCYHRRSVAALAPSLVRALPASSRPLAELIERLRTPLAPERGFSFALHETTSSARPYLIAALHDVLGGQIFVVVPTSDVAERTFTDLTYYLGERAAASVALLRARDETLGALESPSERSARMTLLADLCARKPQVIVAPVAALRQYVIPRAAFENASFQLSAGETADWDATLERLYRLGYARVDVVSAAGEYAVRGGILDVWPATADTPVRVEFFGDDVESIRAFELQSQRSTAPLDAVSVTPWLEILRDEELRDNVLARATGEPNVVSALRAYLAGGADVPEPWLGLAYDEQATIVDYLHRESLVVLEEPGMLDTVEHGLDEERSRGAQALMAGVDSGELDVRDDEVGEALLADVVAPYPRLASYAERLRARRVLVVTGGIESGELSWVPRALDAFVLETRPAEHFNRRIELFTQQVRDWIVAGDTVWLVANGASRLAEILRGANLRVERSAPFATSHTVSRSEEHTSELQSRQYLVCRLLLEKKKNKQSKNVPNHQPTIHPGRRHHKYDSENDDHHPRHFPDASYPGTGTRHAIKRTRK